MATKNPVPIKIKLFLTLLFFIGIVTYVFVVVDAGWTNFFITVHTLREVRTEKHTQQNVTQHPKASPSIAEPSASNQSSSAAQQNQANAQNQGATFIDSVRKSIVLVLAKINDNETSQGTGFVVKSGFVATNAHVVENGKSVILVDYQGNRYPVVTLRIGSSAHASQDIAILGYNEGQDHLPALPLADISEGKPNEKIQTVGFPIVALESGRNAPVPSNEGVIANYNPNEKIFYSQGMILNQGNSGGPVFMLANHKVIGMAEAKTKDRLTAEGVAIFIPSTVVKEFFHKRTGETLP